MNGSMINFFDWLQFLCPCLIFGADLLHSSMTETDCRGVTVFGDIHIAVMILNARNIGWAAFSKSCWRILCCTMTVVLLMTMRLEVRWLWYGHNRFKSDLSFWIHSGSSLEWRYSESRFWWDHILIRLQSGQLVCCHIRY